MSRDELIRTLIEIIENASLRELYGLFHFATHFVK